MLRREEGSYGEFNMEIRWDESPECSYCGIHCTGEWVLFIEADKTKIGIALPKDALEPDSIDDKTPQFTRDAWLCEGFCSPEANRMGTKYNLTDLEWAAEQEKDESISKAVKEFIEFCKSKSKDSFYAYEG